MTPKPILHLRTLLFSITTFMYVNGKGQLLQTNFGGSTWSNAASWLYNQIPNDSDNVVLIQDVTVDIPATCYSLTTNGYNVTIAPGGSLNIMGRDTLSDHSGDSLIATIKLIYTRNGGEAFESDLNLFEFDYDQQKRISKVFSRFESDEGAETKYYYNGNSSYPTTSDYHNFCADYINDHCIESFEKTFYLYDAEGYVTYDSILRSNTADTLKYWQVRSYQLHDNMVTLSIRYNYFNIINGKPVEGVFSDNIDIERTLVNGNISSQESHPATGEGRYHKCSYDHQPNPLYRTTPHYYILPDEQIEFDGPEQFNNKILNEETLEYGDLKYYAAYSYNHYKYPSYRLTYDMSGDEPYVWVMQYLYKPW